MIDKTILVIDTDTETTQKIISTLEAEDYLVFTAPGGDIGITMAKKVIPSLIFVNPSLAGTSGLEVCKTIHGMELFKNVPIIALSAFEGAMDPRYTSIYGIVDSLKKPFSPEELITKTKNVLAKKPFEAQPIETAEEYVDSGEGEEAIPIEEEMPETHKKVVEEIDISDKTIKMREDVYSDKTEVKQMGGDIGEEKTEHIEIPREETEEPMVEPEKTYVLKKNIRRKGMRDRLLVPIIAGIVIVVILGGTGFVLYKKNLLPWIGTKIQEPVTIKPAKPVQQQAAQVPPSQEQQKPAPTPTSKSEVKPSEKPAPSTPAPPPSAPKPMVKPTGKVIYSVQIGAFKSESNATALTKQYKEKGYEAFTHKAQKDREIIYRVLIGKLENNKETSKLAASISSKEKIKTVIFKE